MQLDKLRAGELLAQAARTVVKKLEEDSRGVEIAGRALYELNTALSTFQAAEQGLFWCSCGAGFATEVELNTHGRASGPNHCQVAPGTGAMVSPPLEAENYILTGFDAFGMWKIEQPTAARVIFMLQGRLKEGRLALQEIKAPRPALGARPDGEEIERQRWNAVLRALDYLYEGNLSDAKEYINQLERLLP